MISPFRWKPWVKRLSNGLSVFVLDIQPTVNNTFNLGFPAKRGNHFAFALCSLAKFFAFFTKVFVHWKPYTLTFYKIYLSLFKDELYFKLKKTGSLKNHLFIQLIKLFLICKFKLDRNNFLRNLMNSLKRPLYNCHGLIN